MKRVFLVLPAIIMLLTSFAPKPSQAKARTPLRPAVKAAMVGAVEGLPERAPARVDRPQPEARLAKQAQKPRPAPVAAAASVATGSVWDALAQCESGGRWSYNGGSGFDGGLQFHPGTWAAYAPNGYPAYAWQATREQQIAVAELVLASQGWGAWPACSRKLGLR